MFEFIVILILLGIFGKIAIRGVEVLFLIFEKIVDRLNKDLDKLIDDRKD